MSDSRAWSSWLLLAFKLSVLLACTYFAYRMMGLQGVVFSSVAGLAIILPHHLIEFASFLKYLYRRHQYIDWEGEYLEYAGQHLRAWRHGGELWFSVRDICRALDEKPADENRLQRTLPENCWCIFQPARGMVITEAGVKIWLDKRTAQSVRKLLIWLERNVFFVESRRRLREPDPLLRTQPNKAHVPFKRSVNPDQQAGSPPQA